MTALAIDIDALTKVFDGKTVVDKISLQVEAGKVYGFLGSNGSGKTTMIRMICGLLTPTSGKGYCLGHNILSQSKEIKAKIGYMPQKFSLYAGLTVSENLQFCADVYQVRDKKRAIGMIIDDLELGPYQKIKTGNLSGGWKQRLALACCLVHQPQLIFLDEPTAGIDPKARKDFWNYLYKISSRDGTTVLITTHYMDEAEKCSDLAYINLGKLLYSGATRDLLPFSKVQTYHVAVPYEKLTEWSTRMIHQYPRLLICVVNNELRVSSRHADRLAEFVATEKDYPLQKVHPTFEEVFIGLMQP